VRSILFEDHEGSYLAGVAAALASRSNKVGFIGGMDIPHIRRFQLGFESGAKKMKPNIQVISNYVGISIDAWNNPAKAKELALAQYASGADVIFHAAGASGMGLFDAAEEKQKLAIGVDSNQNGIKPGRVLTSMLKRVDVSVVSAAEDLSKNQFTTGIKRYGLSSGGVDYAVDVHNQTVLTSEMRAQLENIKKQIVSGQLKVPDYYKVRKAK
jgi:basic membrane protein A